MGAQTGPTKRVGRSYRLFCIAPGSVDSVVCVVLTNCVSHLAFICSDDDHNIALVFEVLFGEGLLLYTSQS